MNSAVTPTLDGEQTATARRATQRRAGRREHQAAAALGGKRVRRGRGERAQDVTPIVLPTGERLVVEVKSRKRSLGLVAAALAQARRYDPRGTPVAVLYGFGETDGIAALPLSAFARIAGIDLGSTKLPPATPLRRERSPQLDLFATTAPRPKGDA